MPLWQQRKQTAGWGGGFHPIFQPVVCKATMHTTESVHCENLREKTWKGKVPYLQINQKLQKL